MSNMSNKKKQVIDFMSKFKRNLQAKKIGIAEVSIKFLQMLSEYRVLNL